MFEEKVVFINALIHHLYRSTFVILLKFAPFEGSFSLLCKLV